MALLNGFKETETEQQYRRGEIYYINNASKEHVGSEMKKDRPAVIVSCDANNKHSDVLEVVFLTSAPKKDLPTHVTIRSTGRKSEALCEQPTPVSVERINNFVGKASEKEMERLQRFEAGSKQIAEMTGKPHEEVAEAILKVTTETSASLEEATEQVRERMELQAEVAAEAKEESDTPFVQRWAEALGMTVQELEQQTGWTAEQLEQNIIDSSRIITTELVKAQRLMKILMTNNGRRRKGIPMVRRQQLLRAERNQRRRRSENRKES